MRGSFRVVLLCSPGDTPEEMTAGGAKAARDGLPWSDAEATCRTCGGGDIGAMGASTGPGGCEGRDEVAAAGLSDILAMIEGLRTSRLAFVSADPKMGCCGLFRCAGCVDWLLPPADPAADSSGLTFFFFTFTLLDCSAAGESSAGLAPVEPLVVAIAGEPPEVASRPVELFFLVTAFFGLDMAGDGALPTVSTVVALGILALDDFVLILLVLLALFCDAPAAEEVEAIVS